MDDWQILLEYYVMDERFVAGVMTTLLVMLALNVALPWIFKNVGVIRQFVQPPKKPPKQEEKPLSPLQQAFGCGMATLSLAIAAMLLIAIVFVIVNRG